MTYLKVADLIIKAEGFESEYFGYRTKEYLCKDSTEPDLSVTVDICENISVPEYEVIAVSDFRRFCRTDDGYCFYDLHEGRCIAVVFADREWKNVTASLTDVSEIGGADNDVRRFNLLGEAFRYRLLYTGGISYHSSTISYKGNGVIFTALSGTGKSTHTGLWKEYYGEDTEIINDDNPAVRFIDGKAYLFGTPWSGKTDINKNVRVPATAVVFLQRGIENSIAPISGIEGYRRLIGGVMILPVYEELMNTVLEKLEKMAEIPMYVLNCNISREAVETVKNKIFG